MMLASVPAARSSGQANAQMRNTAPASEPMTKVAALPTPPEPVKQTADASAPTSVAAVPSTAPATARDAVPAPGPMTKIAALPTPPEPVPESADAVVTAAPMIRSEEHTSELQSLMRISYAVFCLKKKKKD